MVLQNYEVDGDNIIITKDELEKWRDHYYPVPELPIEEDEE